MSGGFTWDFDAPSGVYKNHALSSKLRKAAIAETKFMQFVEPEPGYGKQKGESITITRLSNIAVPTNGRISENRTIPEDDLVVTTVAITVSEWGRSVPFTSFAEDLSKFNVRNKVQSKLRDQMKLTMDIAAADAFKTAQIKAIPSGSTSLVFDTDGVASTVANSNLNVFHLEQIRDYMFSTLNVPAFSGDDYIGLVSTKGKRGIINDPNFEKWHVYTSPEKKFNSEIGRIENIRFIEVNHLSALSGSLGSGGVLGEAVIFGEDAVAMALVEDPELRAAVPTDFGRKKSIAWYGILEFGLIWDTANPGEARVIHVTSA
jgi:N4-gp56 family major capsid protein